jgi:hypothetical protein
VKRTEWNQLMNNIRGERQERVREKLLEEL